MLNFCMAKKKVGSKSKSKSSSSENKPKKKRMTARERDEMLIENFVGLQHAMTNLSIKFESLSENITKLLGVFEESAKSLVQGGGKESDKDMLKKIDSLLDQNKTIAKGLVLMESKLRNRAPEFPQNRPGQNFVPQGGSSQDSQRHKPLPRS